MLHFERWKIFLISAVLILGVAYAAPNLFDEETLEGLPGWMPNETVSLGLDLQGGVYLLANVDVEGVLDSHLENLTSTVRARLNEQPNPIGYRSLGAHGDKVVVSVRDDEDADQMRQRLRDLGEQYEIEDDGAGNFEIVLTEEGIAELQRAAVQQTIEIIGIRINELGVREPTLQKFGDDRIVIQLPGVDDPQRVKDAIGQTAKMTFHLVDERVAPGATSVPATTRMLPSVDEVDAQGNPIMLPVLRNVVVGGEHLTNAQPSFQDNQPVVSFNFNTVGAKKFGRATQENVGRRLAIVLDGAVISAPTIRSAILGGSGVITGNFTVQSAGDLSLLLRAGALPADISYGDERSVGPSLGADSVAAGKIASILGLIFVIAFMVLIYGMFGAMANVALAANIVLILGALSVLQATLTLPGIAGIVLTIGMAVDANVLIFERIREEFRSGRGAVMAIDAGYRRALTTIIDANVTTLIAAVLLFQFGSGPIKGFAVTLSIGIVTSMFTAIMVTRFIIVMWLRRKRPETLPI